MKESGKERLKSTIYESTRAPLTRSPFPNGEGKSVAASPSFWLTVFPYRQPSPRGEGAPKGRIGHRRYEREWENASQVDDLRKHPIHRSAVPLPRWGRQIGGGFAAILRLRSQLFWHSLSHIRRFSPLRMTKRGKTYFQHNKKGYRLMSDSLFT
ncbi:MAG: hypothetical protein EGQ71_01110 [Dialister sp.]|nr:hypothetical protein [Dialister sp.]